MKITFSVLSLIFIFNFTASALSALLVETTIAEINAKGEKSVLTAPRVIVESGKQAVIRVGSLEYAVTPTLLGDGTVDLRATLTKRDGKKADQIAAPRIIAKLGQTAEIKVGTLAFKAKTSLAK